MLLEIRAICAQSRTCRRTTTIDAYPAHLSDPQRAALEKLRRDIKAAAPAAEECISYDIPGYRLGSKLLVSFGAAKNHCSSILELTPFGLTRRSLSDMSWPKGRFDFPLKNLYQPALSRSWSERALPSMAELVSQPRHPFLVRERQLIGNASRCHAHKRKRAGCRSRRIRRSSHHN